MERRRKEAKVFWKKFYPGDPFTLPREQGEILRHYKSILKLGKPSKFSYDIIAAASRQKSFYYQVSLPHFKTEWFLLESLSRYSEFLQLKKIHPNAFLVPCYDIDLVWHTHPVHPVCYAKDCQKILGAILPHDDTDPDRSEDSKLNTSFTTTQQLWRDAYNTDYCIPGSIGRAQESECVPT